MSRMASASSAKSELTTRDRRFRAREEKRILYVQYTNPGGYPPLEHSSRILAQAGWQVRFLGVGAVGADRLELPAQANRYVHKLPFVQGGWRQKVHYMAYWAWALAWTIYWRPQWVYVSDPLAAPVGLVLGRWPGVNVVYHEHDSPPAPAPQKTSRFMRWVWKCRRKLAEQACLNILPNRRRLEAFRRAVGTARPSLCVWNCPTRDEVAKADSGAKGSGGLRLFYHGSIVPARLPLTVLEALAQVEGTVLEVAGYETVGHRGYVQQLRETAEKLELGKRFRYLGVLPSREALLEACRRAQVGLALMPRDSSDVNERAMAGASNKPFEYLACGLALLVSDLPDWQELFVEPGYALACRPGTATSIADSLVWFRDHPAARQRMGQAGRERILTEWNYETQFAPVQRMLESHVCVNGAHAKSLVSE